MPLPSGNWTLNSNGIPGSLQINPVDVAGSVNGTIVTAFDGIQRPISGLWDEMLQNMTFAVGWSDGVYAGTGYIGFLIKDQLRMPGIRGATVWTLTGYYHASSTGDGTTDRPILGWYAQIGST